ncbi:MAG: Uma2 family endonuclease [Gammaproteobacteria bacterium]|nr:Uma2 family endonuclease [Gammaproteobacteria bacterium]
MGTTMETWPRRHRITVDDYHRMAEVGLLAPDARVELIDGEIFEMAPIGKEHNSVVDQLTRLFVRAVGDAIVRVQGSIRLGTTSEPQPDLVLLRPSADFYRSRFATAADALLVVEVSDTTLRYDRDVKVPLYARHGVLEVWIVDLSNERLLVFEEPEGGDYRRRDVVERPSRMSIAALPRVDVDLSALFD